MAALYLAANPTATPAQVETALKTAATPNKVTNAGSGSPNLLLYVGAFGDGGSTTPTPTAPAAPTLLSPSNGATRRPVTNSAVSWSAVAGASYIVQLSTTLEFSSPFATRTVASGTTSTSFSALSALTTYYWRVASTNANGTTWSAPWRFTTALGVPVLSSPANTATNVSRTPILVWTFTGAASYDIQVARSSKFSSTSLIINNTTSATSVVGTTYTVPVVLNSRTTYYWRVRSRAANGTTSSWPSSRRFTTTL